MAKVDGKNTIVLMNDKIMYCMLFRNKLPRTAAKFAEKSDGQMIGKLNRMILDMSYQWEFAWKVEVVIRKLVTNSKFE